MFYKREKICEECEAIVVNDIGFYSLRDTLECGQCFRYELTRNDDEYVEYITIYKEKLIRVGQRTVGELIFYDVSDEDFENVIVPYFSLSTDYEEIRSDILKRTNSDWLKEASLAARGIAILKQDTWETLFSFIISQNNNIPRIRKIIKQISAEYGVNICLQNKCDRCPLNKIKGAPCDEVCKSCGVCYTFPSAEDIMKNPEKLLPSKPGFRYKYLLDAAEKIYTGAVNLEKIAAARSYEYTKSELMKIKGVGEKVASCVALFGFSNLEAFPVDVWMKRAIDEYFDGSLDATQLGRYAGVAQQYIFHYIRNLQQNKR